tara:strand:- start:60509 stop:60631 length:123 start_codon:yes stop_codon:yes gene_type:complete
MSIKNFHDADWQDVFRPFSELRTSFLVLAYGNLFFSMELT